MFIREVKKRLGGPQGIYEYVHHRLVESVRTPNGPRQKVVLNLGTLDIGQEKFKTLANMIEAIINKNPQQPLFDEDPGLVPLAHHFAEQVVRKRLQQSEETEAEAPAKAARPEPKKQYETVDVNSTTSSHGKTIGAEHIALSQLKQLSFFKILGQCGFNQKQQQYAAAQVCARMVHPASERETARWLRETSGLDELLGADFSTISDFTLHHTADQLLAQKDVLETKLSQATRDLFALDETLVLYDLTNTYFESPKWGSKIARYGKSKEKRNDCPLVTLALVVDGQGFPKRSKIFEGNVGEAKTLWKILGELGDVDSNKGPRTVVIDAGIATEENLGLLRQDKRFEYVAISRKKKFPRDLFANSATTELELSKHKQLTVKSARDGEELFLLCQSPDRLAKDEAIFNRRKQRFEAGLTAISNGLQKPRTRKKYTAVLERIGRLKERYKIGRFYTIDVVEKDGKATMVNWKCNQANEPGQYLIRTSRTDLLDRELSLIHRTLTMIESAFRWLKSDLGMQPNYHQYDRRMEAHIFISVLGYFGLAPILNKLGWGGKFVGHLAAEEKAEHDWKIPYGWCSVVKAMQTQVRITTSSLCADGQRLDIRTTLEPTANQLDLYRRLKIKSRPLKRVVLKQGRPRPSDCDQKNVVPKN